MSDRTWWGDLMHQWASQKGTSTISKRKGVRQSGKTRLHVECLEDRRLLSVSGLTATNSVDLSGWCCYSRSSTTPIWGDTVSLSCQVKRTGNLATSAFNVQWYLCKTTSIASDSLLLSQANGATSYKHAAIGAKATYGSLFTVNLKLPTALPKGWSGSSFYIVMKTDSGSVVTESNEKNNAGQVGNTYDRWAIKITTPATNKAPTVATAAKASSSTVTTTSVTLSALGADDGGESNLKYTWSATTLPSGASSPTFSANGTNAAKSTLATFSAAGTYTFKVTIADKAGLTATSTVQVVVNQTLTSVSVSPSTVYVVVNGQQQFTVTALDQFGKTMTTQPAFTWKASSGTISSTGLYTAPSATGSATVTATSGSLSATANLSIVVGQFLGMTDDALSALTQTLFADGSISRLDMIQILQSVGSDDGVVDITELTSLKIIINSATYLSMADSVKVLAGDVVNGNTANAHYQGSTLGNLAIGSNNAQLTKLINKWFYGTDHPTTTNSSYTYKTVSGSLFVAGPSYTDLNQGALGDCYLLAAAGAIAKSNTTAITNIFTDNGDGTWTVRFYYDNGPTYVTDYVTVDNMLPVNGSILIYAGYGSIYTNTSNELWTALLEKAYAQWNETGLEGRDGTNTYAGIASGWMDSVNSQVLGYDSSFYYPDNSTKAVLINALTAGKAVTAGTWIEADGLYAPHAYVVLSYNSITDTFQLYNPWGFDHPGPLTWSILQTDCDGFVVTDTYSVASSSVGQPLIVSPFDPAVTQPDVTSSRLLTSTSDKAASAPVGQVASTSSAVQAASADVCYRSWGADSLVTSPWHTRESHDPLENIGKLSPLTADPLFLL
jgi:hypothetical protein